MKQILFSISLLAGLAFNTGCETDEDNTVAKAQQCLDKTNRAGAGDCLNMVSGLESADSYSIRCAARFLMNGLTTARVAEAMSNLKTAGAGRDPAAIMMGTFAFSDPALEALAFADCNKSESASFIYIAQVARMGTIITGFDGSIGTDIAIGNPVDPAAIDAAVDLAAANPAAQASIGATAVQLAATQCTVPGQNTEICDQVNAAIAPNLGNNQAIGAALLALLKD
ncbi:MAG: hypothetical protein SGJ18_11055 [Pseudomonadota bacterium]|nr:hypothetical protein [Pseudomonadota bacterium]